MNESIHSIYAYEPSEKIFSFLKKNLDGLSKAHVYNSGIGAVAEQAKFYVDDRHPSSSSLVKDALPEEFYIVEEQLVDIKEASNESKKWTDEGTEIFYKSDTQGYDITIAANLGISLFEKVAGAIIEIYPKLEEQQKNMNEFMEIFNSFENRGVFENPKHKLSQQDFSDLVRSGKGFDLLLWR